MKELTDITITKFSTDLRGRSGKIYYICLKFETFTVAIRLRVGFTLSEVLLVLLSSAHAISTAKDGDSIVIGSDDSLEAVTNDTQKTSD